MGLLSSYGSMLCRGWRYTQMDNPWRWIFSTSWHLWRRFARWSLRRFVSLLHWSRLGLLISLLCPCHQDPYLSRAFLNRMLVEFPPSTSMCRSKQLLTVKYMTKPSWCSSLHMSSSSKVMDIASNFISSFDLQDLGTLEEGDPSLASRLAVDYVSLQT